MKRNKNSGTMRNIILEKVVLLFLRLMLVLSVYLLLRGHNNPGGGFIAGIIASTGFIFYGIIFGSDAIQKLLRIDSRKLMGIGLLLVLVAAVLPVVMGHEPLTGLWVIPHVPLLGELHLGTPLLFDTGVFLVVTGVILTIVVSVMEVLKWN
jgi:multicomponent Na+:H+ antiporter subunit B